MNNYTINQKDIIMYKGEPCLNETKAAKYAGFASSSGLRNWKLTKPAWRKMGKRVNQHILYKISDLDIIRERV